MTLTHSCHNAFADSCGLLEEIEPYHGGLRQVQLIYSILLRTTKLYSCSSIGRSLIAEMNRLGVLVDLSHTSDATAKQALQVSKAPVIWSHSSARVVHDVPRNVPNDVLKLIGIGEGLTDAVVMVQLYRQVFCNLLFMVLFFLSRSISHHNLLRIPVKRRLKKLLIM